MFWCRHTSFELLWILPSIKVKAKYSSELNAHMLLKGPSVAMKRGPHHKTVSFFITEVPLQTIKTVKYLRFERKFLSILESVDALLCSERFPLWWMNHCNYFLHINIELRSKFLVGDQDNTMDNDHHFILFPLHLLLWRCREYFFAERKHTAESAFSPSTHGLPSWSHGDINFYLQKKVMKAFTLFLKGC